MKKEDRQLVFKPLLKDFETDMFKAYFKDMVTEIPDYIFTMPSSTSGKYHNATQCEKFGQVYHEYIFASILNHRLRLKGNREKYNTPEIRDCMRCVPVFHDAVKCGWNGSKYTVHEHPKISSGKQYMSHCFIHNEAVKVGFYPKDLYILLAKNRLVADWQLKNQKNARKFHSYFWVFEKTNKRIIY